MTDNFMEKIAAAMGLKIGDKIHLYDRSGEYLDYGDEPYTVTADGVVDCEGLQLCGDESEAFFAGRFEKVVDADLDEKLRNIEDELELMSIEIDDLTAEVRDIMEHCR